MELVIGADNGEIEATEHPCHILQSEVELMVADGAGIVMHEIHQATLHVTLEQGIVR